MAGKQESSSLRPVYAPLGILFILMISAMGYVFHAGHDIIDRQIPIIDATTEMALQATEAHLLLEEYLQGDTHANMNEVRSRLGDVAHHALAMTTPGQQFKGRTIYLDNAELRAEIDGVIEELGNLLDLEGIRLIPKHESPESAIEEPTHDEVFQVFLESLGHIRDQIQRDIQFTNLRFQRTQIALMGGLITIMGGCGFVISRQMRRRLKVEAALGESEDKFSTAFHSSPVSLVISRLKDGRIIDVNEGFLHMTGLERDEVIDRTSLELSIWQDPSLRDRVIASLESGKPVRNLEASFFRRHGEPSVGRLSVILVDIGGETHLLTTVEDITERLRAEKARRTSEDHLRRLVEGVKAVIWEYNRDTHCFTFVSPWAFELLGYPEEVWFAPHFWHDRLHPDDVEATLAYSREQEQLDHAFTMEYRIVAADGRVIWIQDISSPSEIVDGVCHQKGVMIDITASKGAAQTVRDNEERLRRIVTGVDAIVWEFDRDENRFTFISPHAEKIVGYTREDMYQPGFWRDHIHPEDRKETLILADEQEIHGDSITVEYRFTTADNRVIWVRDISGPVIKEQGHCRQKGVIFDITHQKRLQILHDGQRRVLERLAEDTPLPELLTVLAQSTETVFPEMRCTILILDRATGRLRHGAAPSMPDYYNQAVDGLAIGPGVASCGAAAHDNELVIIEDVMTHPNWAHFRSMAARVGFRSCWSEPIVGSSNIVLGTLALYYDQPRTPTDEELAMIQSVSRLASVAIERSRHEESFQDLITGTASVTGQSFFPVLVKHLAHANGVRHAIVTELVNDRLQMLAFWNGDGEGEPITYTLNDTPCEMVFQDGEYFCPQGFQNQFPNDPDLVELKAESYYGVTLVDGQDRTIGHICVLDDKPMLDGSRIARIVRLFAIRAAAELERIQADAIIRQQAATERLLRNELDHRVRNNLASLTTLVDMSRRSANTPEQFTTAVKGRINTMLTAHNLLSRSQGRDIGLCHLIHALTPPELQKQIRREGKPVVIHTEKAPALAMVLHELLSNSMKHGSLSVPEGRVRLSWEQQDGEEVDTLALKWRETNGPEIDPDPTPGVGTSLIEGIVRSDLQGVATLRYLPTGVDHEFTINLQSSEPPEKSPENNLEILPVKSPVIMENKSDPEPAAR